MQAKVGREREYEAALRYLRGKNSDISEEATEIKVILLNHSYYKIVCDKFTSYPKQANYLVCRSTR